MIHRRVFALVVAVVMLSLISHGHNAASGDPVHYLIAARSIAWDRDLDLANDYGDPSHILRVPADDHARIGRNGVLRPSHDIGWPLVSAPAIAVLYRLAELSERLPESFRDSARLDRFIALRQLVSIGMIVLGVLLGLQFFDAGRQLTGSSKAALAAALACTLSPPVLSHAYVYFTEIPTALIVLWLFTRRNALAGSISTLRAVSLGLVTGFLILIHVRNVGIMLALAAIALWRARANLWRAAAYVDGLAFMLIVKAWLSWYFWGGLFASPHERVATWTGTTAAYFSEPILRMLGLLFDPRHGLFLSAPIYLLMPAAWWLLRRRQPAMARDALIVSAAYLIFVLLPVTNAHGWRGGWSPAARFLVPIAPLLALGWPLVAELRHRALIGAVAVIQLGLLALFWSKPMLLWNEGPGPAAHLEALFGAGIAAALPTFTALDGPVLLWSAAWIAIAAGVTWILLRAPELRPQSH